MPDKTQKKEHGGIPTSGDGIEVEYSSDPDRSGFDQVSTKKLLRKIDWTLIPFLALLYLLSFLDRTNISNARLARIEADLGLAGLDYNVVLAVFFPFYIASEIPSNLAIKKFRPLVWILCIMIVWGIVCTLMGLITNYAGLLTYRMALSLAEGGLFPGINYYITLWYRRHECGFRIAIFFSTVTAAGAFGGLLARGIVEMDGVSGKPGWAWIFILEGLATLVITFAAFFVMNDYPSTAKFLTIAEKEEDAIKDWKIWVYIFITISIYTPLYSYSLFLPTIVRTLGYSNETAQLMTVPPYVVACVVCVAGGYVADRHGQRRMYIISFGIVSFVMLIATHNNTVKYVGYFLATASIFPNIPQGRGVSITMHISFGNLSRMIASFMFQSKHSPQFYPGHAAIIRFLTMSLIGSIFMMTYLRRENARRDREYKSPSEYTAEEMMAERGKGDDATFFRYTI
ncbi:major facilitator superfamily transporter [Dactylonectria macrodidyma]|uniref:Major facilitator superfamily transporter n=1 Tax=Dactylonectria macrodidyma TaxID=307937 RepID=A0A9P9EVN2_9HYPO|nr:major facilitator superfamily transporter [Dactylonectria macrodidyma]